MNSQTHTDSMGTPVSPTHKYGFMVIDINQKEEMFCHLAPVVHQTIKDMGILNQIWNQEKILKTGEIQSVDTWMWNELL